MEAALRDKLRKIEALFAGAGTAGEREAAGAARDRIRARLAEFTKRGPARQFQVSLPDQWSRQLFVALCRRYDLKPYRLPRQRRTTVMVRVPQDFVNEVLWPEFEQLNAALREYLSEVTERVIAESVHADASDAPEEPEVAGQLE